VCSLGLVPAEWKTYNAIRNWLTSTNRLQLAERAMSQDVREGPDRASNRGAQPKGARTPVAPGTEKDRLAAALRENLKRRKAQISARRQILADGDETAPK